MDKNTLSGKTAAGREALTTRPAGLGPRLRSVLITLTFSEARRQVVCFINDQLAGRLPGH